MLEGDPPMFVQDEELVREGHQIFCSELLPRALISRDLEREL